MLSCFHLIPERNKRTDGQTDGQTDGRTDLLYQYRASVCWRAIKIIGFSWNFVHSSRFLTGWTPRDQKWKSCIGQTPSSTERISCFKITFSLRLKRPQLEASKTRAASVDYDCQWIVMRTGSLDSTVRQWRRHYSGQRRLNKSRFGR